MDNWGEDLYPNPIDVNETLEKVRFFLGDRWVDVGKMEMVFEGRYAVDITMPDVEGFLEQQFELDNGSEDWLIWGTRMN
jgi:hypothetical protein